MAGPTPGLTRRYSTVIGMTGLIGALVLAVVLDYAIAELMSLSSDPAMNRPVVLGWRMSRVIAGRIGLWFTCGIRPTRCIPLRSQMSW